MFEEDIFQRPITRVEWLLGNQCNYQCSYCHEMFRKGDMPFPNPQTVLKICQDIIFHYDDLGRDVVFNFIGGEPTLIDSISEIGRSLHNHPVNIVLRTNGSASLQWWEKSKKYLSEVVISVHKEFASLRHITEIVRYLREDIEIHPVNVKILIPVSHKTEHWRWGVRVVNYFRKEFGLGELQLLYSNFGRGSSQYFPYSEAQILEYNKINNIVPHPIPDAEPGFRPVYRYKGYTCMSGIDQLVIDNDGSIYRGWCYQGSKIGSIYDEELSLPRDPIVCGKDHCRNGFDQQSEKIKN